MVNLVYSDATNLKFFVKQKLQKYIWNRAFQPSVFGALPILNSEGGAIAPSAPGYAYASNAQQQQKW